MIRLIKLLSIFLCVSGTLSTAAQNWAEYAGGLEGPARQFAVDTANDYLYMIGKAKYVGDSLQINGFSRFDGSEWNQLPIVDTSCILACSNMFEIAYYDGAVYIAYELDPWEFVGSIGRFDGTDFQYDFAVTDTNSGISAMEVINGKLWCIGSFETLNGQAISNIGIWDGTEWSTVPNPGFTPTPGDIQEYQGKVYVCGNIHHPDMTEIMVWDGQEWSAVGGGLTNNGWANTMAVYQGELYVGGNFWKAWGAPGDNIAKWNGSEWSEVGGGTGGIGSPNGQVTDLLVHDGYLYACGQFQYAGGMRSDYFARWDGNEWCVMGTTMTGGYVGDLVAFQGELIASGGFQVINGDSITRLATWIGGDWTDSCGVVSNVLPQPQAHHLEVYPNPTSSNTNVVLPEGQRITAITVHNTLGKLVHGPVVPAMGAATSATLNLSGLPAGLYVVRVQAGREVYVQHVMLSN